MDTPETTIRYSPSYCRYCNKTALYEVELSNGMGVDICSLDAHTNIMLTGKYRVIKYQLNPKDPEILKHICDTPFPEHLKEIQLTIEHFLDGLIDANEAMKRIKYQTYMADMYIIPEPL